MTRRKRNMLLLVCLLVVAWLAAGFFEAGHQTVESQNTGKPISSMSAVQTGADCVETSGSAQLIRPSSDWLRTQQFKPGLFAMTMVGAVLLVCVILSLKLFSAINLAFDFCGIISFIHKKDGKK